MSSRIRPGVAHRRYTCADHGRFSTWETTTRPPRSNSIEAVSRAERLAKRREQQRRYREADPDYAAKVRRWKLRAEARHEAADTGEPVEAIYQRWNVG